MRSIGQPHDWQPYEPPKKRRKPRYGDKQRVRGGTALRARSRLEAVGGKVGGVDASDGISGREARAIKRRFRRDGRPGQGGGTGNDQLTPEQREARSLRRDTRAAVDLRYGRERSQLDYERRLSEQHSQNMGGWYAKHQADVQAATAAQAGYAQGFQQASYQQANTAAATDTSQNAALLQQQQASAAQRGTTVDPSVAQTLQAGVAARQATGTAGGNLIGAQGQAQTAYMGNQQVVAGQQGLQAQSDEANRRRKIEQLAADLAREEGQFAVDFRRQSREDEHKRQLEDAAFGLDVEQEANDKKQAAADDRLARQKARRDDMEADRKYQLDLDKFGAAEAKDRYQRRNGLGPYKPSADKDGKPKARFTPLQRREARSEWRNIVARVRGGKKIAKETDPLMVRAAEQYLNRGAVSDATRRRIKRDYGISLPRSPRGPGNSNDGGHPSTG